MKCPIDVETDLQMADRQGIEIDYCPKCRGVWLDRGELDKIIERSASAIAPGQAGYEDYQGGPPSAYPQGSYPQEPYPQGDDPRRRRRGGFLGDLFDFD